MSHSPLEFSKRSLCLTNLLMEIILTSDFSALPLLDLRDRVIALCHSSLFLCHPQKKKQKATFYLFVLVGERESLYGGLDRSTVYTAQPVLQLQELLQWRKEKNGNLLVEISHLMHPRTPASNHSVVHRQAHSMINLKI